MARGQDHKQAFANPLPSEAARFDPVRKAWILSLHEDVYAALREPALVQASAQNQTTSTDPLHLHATVRDDIARMSAVEWRTQMEREASMVIAHATHGRPIDLVKEIIHPWSVAVMLALNGVQPAESIGPRDAKRLTRIAGRLFYKGDRLYEDNNGVRRSLPQAFRNKWRAWRGKSAAAELDRMLQQRRLILSNPVFAGLTQTLPSFLARAWLALLQNPDQKAKLLTEPALMSGAIEELLRYAGIVHTLHRQASKNVCIGEAQIVQGQGVILKLDSANHDPARFDRPDRLDVTRRPAGNLALGTGMYACAGAIVVRSAFDVITPLFLAAGPTLEPDSPVVWTADTAIRWPRVVSARFQGGARPVR